MLNLYVLKLYAESLCVPCVPDMCLNLNLMSNRLDHLPELSSWCTQSVWRAVMWPADLSV
jgi:hypothetical protein